MLLERAPCKACNTVLCMQAEHKYSSWSQVLCSVVMGVRTLRSLMCTRKTLHNAPITYKKGGLHACICSHSADLMSMQLKCSPMLRQQGRQL